MFGLVGWVWQISVVDLAGQGDIPQDGGQWTFVHTDRHAQNAPKLVLANAVVSVYQPNSIVSSDRSSLRYYIHQD